MTKSFISHAAILVLLLGTHGPSLSAAPDTKLTPAELMQKHLESIGTADARSRAHGRRIKGNSTITAREGGAGQASGQVVMSSQGILNLINMTFDSGEPSVAFAFDGQHVTATQFRPGRRTALEQFFASYEEIVREGLVGGTLSDAWPLLNVQEKNPKLEYEGLKKIEGKQLHALKYSPRKGSELKITLYFDAETFRHVRTEYQQTIYSTEQRRISPGGAGTLPSATSARSAPQRLTAYEEFSDFKTEQGLNLPHTYKFELSVQSQIRPILLDWVFNLTDFTFNFPIEPSEFTIK